MAEPRIRAQLQGRVLHGGVPAGEDVIAPFQMDRKTFVQETVEPLQSKAETVYVTPGSDAEAHVGKRFPNKVTNERIAEALLAFGRCFPS